MRKYNLFNFLEKKINTAEIDTIIAQKMEQAAFKELALYIAISYIANTLSKCEIKVYKDFKEVHDEWYYLLNVSPNPNQNASQFINQVIENYFYKRDGALCVLNNDRLYCADDFDIEDDNPLKEFCYHNVHFNSYQAKKKYKASEVFHFKLDNRNVRNLIEALYATYGEIVELALQTFKRTNGKKYKLILDQYDAGDPKFAQLFEASIRDQLKTFIDNDNSVYPQFAGMDLQEFSTASAGNSSDIIAIRKEIFDTTAQALKIPLPMMYGNITNMNEIVKVFLSICIDPIADMLSEELTRKRYGFEEWKNGNFVVVDTSCINHIDILEAADKVDKLIGCGVANIDDMRNRIGWQPLNTDFSKAHWLTKNYRLATNALQELERGGESE